MAQTPLLALTVGDPAGIGPEIAHAAIADPKVRAGARLVVVGPAELRPEGVGRTERIGDHLQPELDDHEVAWIASETAGRWHLGAPSAESGSAALAALRIGHDLAISGAVDALVTGPVSKEAMHLAGEEVEGQTELLGRWSGVHDHQMLAIAGELRVLMLTRHVALREALAQLDATSVVAHLELLHRTLADLGIASPRLALAGLNPHAGEGGLFGDEERTVLAPAAERATRMGLDVTGPVSPDSVFAQAAAGRWDGVLALYHDQGFIPIKLLGADRALTVLAGFPYLRVSPAHGVAMDIAGQRRARPTNLIHALCQAAAWAAQGSWGGRARVAL